MVAVFNLPVRIALHELLASGSGGDGGASWRRMVMQAVGTVRAGHRVIDDGGLLITRHRSIAASGIENALFDGTVEIPDIGSCRVYISSLSIGFVIVPASVETQAELAECEIRLTGQLNPVIARWCGRLTELIPQQGRTLPPAAALPASRLLWFHQVLMNPEPWQEREATLEFGHTCKLGAGVDVVVGNGCSALHGARATHLDDVIEALLYAQQAWMITDEANKLISDSLARLHAMPAGSPDAVDKHYSQVLDLSRDVTLRSTVFRNEARNLGNARLTVYQALLAVWNVTTEVAMAEQGLDSVRRLVNMHRERLQVHRDDNRNQLIFIFTGLTFFQSILVWYDFLTGSDHSVGPAPRPAIAYLVLILSVLVLLSLWLGPKYRVSALRNVTLSGQVEDVQAKAAETAEAHAQAQAGRRAERPAVPAQAAKSEPEPAAVAEPKPESEPEDVVDSES